MIDDLPPLSSGNRFQRAYARWAEPWYARMPEESRDAARAVDAYLYSRRGLWVWATVAVALLAGTAGLWALGLPGGRALVLTLLAVVGVPTTVLGLWLMPARVRHRRWVVRVVAMLGAGMAVGFVGGHLERRGGFEAAAFLDALARAAGPLLLAFALAAGVMLGGGWLVTELRRRHDARRLAHLRLVAERDAAARDAAEARLRRLQAQVQPHFLFNTLSTLQHWVDTRDPRAGPLLRELTGFLRRSTELLGGDAVRLADEVAAVRHYLAIQQARLGERLAFAVDVDPALDGRTLPPGLLLSWVENALEHGIEPALAGGRVTLRAAPTPGGWTLAVADDGLGLAPGWHEGVGLANSRQRLAHAFGDRARLTLAPGADGGTCVVLAIADEPAGPPPAPIATAPTAAPR